MKRALAPALLAIILGACAVKPLRLSYTPQGSRPLQTARRPTVFLGTVVDQTGGVDVYQGEGKTERPLAETLREALAQELARLEIPVVSYPADAEATLEAAVKKASVIFTRAVGINDGIEAEVAFHITVNDGKQKTVLTRRISGKARAIRPGFSMPFASFSATLSAALGQAMTQLGPVLEAEDLVALIEGRAPTRRPAAAASEPAPEPTPARWVSGGAKVPHRAVTFAAPAEAPAASPSVPAAVTPARSDVDELPRQQAAARPRAHAVIIGIERYRERLPAADFAAGDAKLVAEYAKRVLGYSGENVALLLDDRATRGDIEKYLERWLPNRVESGDEVLVYFSGHGAPDPKTGDAYLVPFEGDPTYIEQTGYPLKRLYGQLSKLKAKRVILAMDSCFSGAGGRSVIAKGARPLVALKSSAVPPNLTVITASAGDQISSSYEEKGHGLFTYFLLKGLKERGGGDLRAVYDYLKPEVARVARQQYNADQDPQWRQGQ